jgi:hypothetical protein
LLFLTLAGAAFAAFPSSGEYPPAVVSVCTGANFTLDFRDTCSIVYYSTIMQ